MATRRKTTRRKKINPIAPKAEVKPYLDGIPEPVQDQMYAMRLVCEAMTDPTQEFSIAALARSTGLSEHTVGRLLISEQYRGLISRAQADLLDGAILKGVRRVDRELLSDEHAPIRMVLEATHKLAQIRKLIFDTEQAASETEAAQALRQLAQKLANTKPVKHIEVSTA